MGHTHVAIRLVAAIVLGIVAFSSDATAQQSQRVRGEVESVDGNTVTVKSHDGQTVRVVLAEKLRVNHAISAKLTDLTPGTYVGVGAFPDGDGLKAAHVQIFPPTTGAREGHGAWSADPSGTMTNAPVTAVVAGQSGGMLTLTTKGQSYDIKIGPDTPIMRTVAGTKDLVKKGAWIGITNATEKNGVLTTQQVLVSDDRRYPVR